jgi:hypothetical protein
MKFIDKKGAVYSVIPDNDFFIAIKENENDINLIKEIDAHEQKTVVEAELFNYAKENFLIPAFAAEIRDSTSLVFQGEVFQDKDAIKLTSDEIVEKVQQYFELKKNIDELVSERDAELKDIKKDYNDKIADREDTMSSLEPIVLTGLEAVEVDVSWERDVESEMMVLIRRDTLKAIKCRPMTVDGLWSTNISNKARAYAVEYPPPPQKSFLLEDRKETGDYYDLPKGSVIRLLLLGNDGIPFLKFLPHNDKTGIRYLSKIGEEFPIVVEQKPISEKEIPDLTEGD